MNPLPQGTKIGWKRWRLACLPLAVALLAAAPLRAEPALKEYDVKAAFLYNFATFTEWPAKTFPASDSPFVIGVLGDDPFGPILDQIVRGEKVGGHPLVVQRVRRVDEARSCQILFVSASESTRVGDILHKLRGYPILTVGETAGFAERGGAIGFVTGNNVRLVVNPQAAKEAGVVISAKILRLAQLVATIPAGGATP
ncbi:MAG TPA: YfiR family protein [Opitutaceae bacterium]|nr:YfiR family protein [Opitutaceae bacterium]